MIYIIISLILLIIFYFFSSKVSPIPYFPTNKSDLDMIVKALNMKKEGVVIDLGAGDGTVIFAAAQKAHELGLNTRFYAIDINPILITYMWIQRLFHVNSSHITLILGDMFKIDYISLLQPFSSSVFYIYISPWFTAATAQMIHDQKLKSRIVSYFYPVQDKKEDQKIKGVHDVYIYKS
ncbi:MAG: class I SAM-dependent methyltransferase [Candidatus Roizmanbacteria bacterium]|nr:class I SAM-dependent methyltransferase [Candidatus Roizmanbacteria bacterium]